MNRRWYDSNEHTERALAILKDMDENRRRALSRDLTNVVKQIKEMHDEEENEESDVSIGIDRVLGVYKISNSRRWYDKVSLLSYAMKTMSTLPKEDFYNIMEGISTSLSAEIGLVFPLRICLGIHFFPCLLRQAGRSHDEGGYRYVFSPEGSSPHPHL